MSRFKEDEVGAGVVGQCWGASQVRGRKASSSCWGQALLPSAWDKAVPVLSAGPGAGSRSGEWTQIRSITDSFTAHTLNICCVSTAMAGHGDGKTDETVLCLKRSSRGED